MSPRIELVVAMDRARAIGLGNALPWSLPDDLKHFKALTLGKPLLMGRKTAESLGRALPGRLNLVLTRSGHAPFEGMQVVASVDAALESARAAHAEVLMVIGGGELYAQLLPQAQRLHLTEVDTLVDGADTWFPDFDRSAWIERARNRHPADARHAHAFEIVELEREP
ncbi:dihydrofolate reductase [Aquimonas voraii]|uniref:Dihydrofolate reductase n=1 Tax=Aquimonas voraii TaxID=265719 RepID=A0A1G6SC15_9GAMM|nr:dihydrofolate reductase [Aquimonas voraii]SDD13665.1 dihydrofolate reductase [Aquimonas voraii]